MGSAVDILVKLQKMDNTIKKLKAIVEGKIPELVEKEELTALLNRRINDLHADIQNAQKTVHEKEVDVKEHDNKIIRFREQLNTIKDNKSYKALLDEIAGENNSKAELEEVLLTVYDTEEKLRVDMEDVKSLLTETDKDRSELEKENSKVSAESKEELVGLVEERKKLVMAIDPVTLSKYEQVHRTKENAIVPVRGNCCHGCFMNVTAQIYNQLLLDTDVTFCHSCGAILYLEPEDD